MAREGKKNTFNGGGGDEVFLKKKKKIERGALVFVQFVPDGYRGVWPTATGSALAQYLVLEDTSRGTMLFSGIKIGIYKGQII